MANSIVVADIWICEGVINGAPHTFMARVYRDGVIRLAWRRGSSIIVRVGAQFTEASPNDSVFVPDGNGGYVVAVPRRVWAKLPSLGLRDAATMLKARMWQRQRAAA